MKNIFMGLLFGLCVFHSDLSASQAVSPSASMSGSPSEEEELGVVDISEISPRSSSPWAQELRQESDEEEHAGELRPPVLLAKACDLTVPVQNLPLAYFGKKDVPLKFQQQLSRLFDLVKEVDANVDRVPGAYFSELVVFILANQQSVMQVIEAHRDYFEAPIARDWSFLGKTNVNLNFVNDLRKLCTKHRLEVPPFSIAGLVECIIHNEPELSDTVHQFQEEQHRLLSEESADMRTNTTSSRAMALDFVNEGASQETSVESTND